MTQKHPPTHYHSHPSPFMSVKVQTSHHRDKNSSIGDDKKLSLTKPYCLRWMVTNLIPYDGWLQS
jgi:hypothetical protein